VHQTRLLARALFSRLFESDLMPDGLPQVQLVIWGMLLAAMPTTAYAVVMPKKYAGAQFYIPLGPEFDADRLVLITLSMIVIGVVGLFIWDGVFPDRRDVRILGVLPVPTHRFVIARLAALGRVYVLFATPLCLLQSVVFGLTVTGFGGAIGRINGIAAHFAAVTLASAFVFSALIAAQCLLLVVFGRRAAQAASMTFQVLFAVGLVQLLFFLPELGQILRRGGGAHDGLSTLSAVPPTWFFAVYQQLTPAANDGTAAIARLGLGLTIVSCLLAPALYGASYQLLSQRALEGAPRRGSGAMRTRATTTGRDLSSIFGPPLTRSIRLFTVRTLLRSRSHRMMFAVYAGFAFAFVLSSALSIALRDGYAGFARPGAGMMSMPLVMQFLLLVAIRVIMAVPSEPKARWVFRAAEPEDRAAAIAGARDAAMTVVILPTVLFALAQGLMFWSVATALSHAVFVFVTGRLLAEVLTVRSGKLPFACTYLPGKSRVFALWPVHLLAFLTYAVLFAEIDAALSRRPYKLALFCVAATAVAQLVVLMRNRALRALTSLRFEEEDTNAIFQGFQLSEGLAAAPRPPVSASPEFPAAPVP